MKKVFIKAGFLLVFVMAALSGFSQSKVIFYRKGCLYGGLAGYKVKVDEKELATLKGSSVFATSLTPGTHNISPKQVRRGISLDVKDGQTYVIKYVTKIGLFGARPRLKVMTVEEARKDSKYFREHYMDKA